MRHRFGGPGAAVALALTMACVAAQGGPGSAFPLGGLPMVRVERIPGMAEDVAAAPGGGFVVVGTTVAGNTLGSALTVAPEDALVLAYDPAARMAWTQVVDLGGRDVLRAVVVAPDGSVYAAGSTYEDGGGIRPFLVGLGPEGGLRWTREVLLPGVDRAVLEGLALEADQLVAVGAAALGGEPHPVMVVADLRGTVVAASVFDAPAQANFQWFGVAAAEGSRVVAGPVGLGGGVVANASFAGETWRELTFTGLWYDSAVAAGGFASTGHERTADNEVFARTSLWGPDGALRWVRTYGASPGPADTVEGLAAAGDGRGHVHVAGTNGSLLQASLDLVEGTASYAIALGSKMVLLDYDAAGSLVEAREVGHLADSYRGSGIAVLEAGELRRVVAVGTRVDPTGLEVRPLIVLRDVVEMSG